MSQSFQRGAKVVSGYLWIAPGVPDPAMAARARMAAEVARFRAFEESVTALERTALRRRLRLVAAPRAREDTAQLLGVTSADLAAAEQRALTALYRAFGIQERTKRQHGN